MNCITISTAKFFDPIFKKTLVFNNLYVLINSYLKKINNNSFKLNNSNTVNQETLSQSDLDLHLSCFISKNLNNLGWSNAIDLPYIRILLQF
ncbi:hypothetical protein BpHYR1_004088 [Brachionus plicatilis]|uniref:Uncharacterized protein n=1 Tax=Brachionus plicatilis TaxID=10195 RepID=A0A3M7RNQ8_BRAPC|nr:hypothetical protein BpHYR1_004088 [Brachionus plicatilis]